MKDSPTENPMDKLSRVQLCFDQRIRAEALIEAVMADPERAAYEIIALRDLCESAGVKP
ncbi:MAG: hypothetical protein GJU76_04190 [Gallionella sp.]|jgi:hypothetical protein|nr:hypothetical protein [Gallionella sp.]